MESQCSYKEEFMRKHGFTHCSQIDRKTVIRLMKQDIMEEKAAEEAAAKATEEALVKATEEALVKATEEALMKTTEEITVKAAEMRLSNGNEVNEDDNAANNPKTVNNLNDGAVDTNTDPKTVNNLNDHYVDINHDLDRKTLLERTRKTENRKFFPPQVSAYFNRTLQDETNGDHDPCSGIGCEDDLAKSHSVHDLSTSGASETSQAICDFEENEYTTKDNEDTNANIWQSIRNSCTETTNENANYIPAGVNMGVYIQAYAKKNIKKKPKSRKL